VLFRLRKTATKPAEFSDPNTTTSLYLIKIFLSCSTNLNEKHNNRNIALIKVIRDNYLEIITLLLSQSADLNLVGENHLLFMAVRMLKRLKQLIAVSRDAETY